MKSAIALLVAAVAAQSSEDSAYICETNADCENNFDAILEEWTALNDETEQPEGSEPVKGDLTCAEARLYGTDEESGETGEVTARVCLTPAACDGGKWEDEAGNGVEVAAGACAPAGDAARYLSVAAGLIAATVVAIEL